MDMGREEERSVLVRTGLGVSCAGPTACCGDDDDVVACGGGWLAGDVVVVGDFGGPKADMNERTNARG